MKSGFRIYIELIKSSVSCTVTLCVYMQEAATIDSLNVLITMATFYSADGTFMSYDNRICKGTRSANTRV